MAISISQLVGKKKQLDDHRPLPPEVIKNLKDWFTVELTYTSNAIEGNTLTRQETAIVVEKGLTVEGKSLKEHLEAINHAEALEFIHQLANGKRQDINEPKILDMHKLILQKIDDANAGRYRRVSVRIAGTNVAMPNPAKVPDMMTGFMHWLHDDGNPDPLVKIAADAHLKLVSIHPFVDGNGRAARLLMNLILLQAGYPPALIRTEDRRRYIDAIEKAQTGNGQTGYYQVIYKAIDRSLDIYLKTMQPTPDKEPYSDDSALLKIGQLSDASGEAVHTIRYWTKEGLLEVADYTPGKYQLYEPAMIERVKQIRQWQTKRRLTIQEIKQKLGM